MHAALDKPATGAYFEPKHYLNILEKKDNILFEIR
jgi:hypothetical protein